MPGVSWLPLYHDMGLIGAWLSRLYFGVPVYYPVATGVLEPARAVAVGHPLSPGHDVGGAQLRLRAVRAQSAGRGARRTRSELVASGAQRVRAGAAGDDRPLCPALWAVRVSAGGDAAGVRPGRVLGRTVGAPGRSRPARGPRRPRTARGGTASPSKPAMARRSCRWAKR